jgi:hypothetical protein
MIVVIVCWGGLIPMLTNPSVSSAITPAPAVRTPLLLVLNVILLLLGSLLLIADVFALKGMRIMVPNNVYLWISTVQKSVRHVREWVLIVHHVWKVIIDNSPLTIVTVFKVMRVSMEQLYVVRYVVMGRYMRMLVMIIILMMGMVVPVGVWWRMGIVVIILHNLLCVYLLWGILLRHSLS